MALTPDERRRFGQGADVRPGEDDDLLRTEGAGLLVNLDSLRDYFGALEELERRWLAMPPTARRNLSRILWLHPDGHILPYTTPDSDPTFAEDAADREADPDPFGLADEMEPDPPVPFRRG